MLMSPCNNLISSGSSEKNGYACLSRDAELPKPPGVRERFLVRPPGFELPDHFLDGLPGRWLGRPLDALGYVLDQARLRPHGPDRLTVGSSILRFAIQRTLTDRKCLDTRLKAAKFKSCHHIPYREFNCQTHLQILREVTGWPRVLYCLSVLRTGRSQMVEAFARKY